MKHLPLMIELGTPKSVIIFQMCVAVSSFKAPDLCLRDLTALVEPRRRWTTAVRDIFSLNVFLQESAHRIIESYKSKSADTSSG